MALKILMTNNTLDFRSGSELYIRDVALALQERGHCPVAYSTRLGEVAEDLKQAGLPVTDDLQALPFRPDIIHGQHHMETMAALLQFPALPAVYFCHGTVPWEETPPDFPRIYHYVAVDDRTAQHVLDKTQVKPDRVHRIPNFVDLQRFRPRGPLPERPRKAAIFSSTLHEGHIPIIREACRRLGLELDLLGMVSGKVCRHPERVLGGYDLILAKGRAALESLAVGASVLLCDYAVGGPLVTSANLDRLRRFNLGLACLDRSVSVESLITEINRYDASDAARVSARIRSEAGLDGVIERILDVYRRALEEHRKARSDPASELQAAGRYLQGLGAAVRERDSTLRNQSEALSKLERRTNRLVGEFEQLNNTLTIRLRNRILKAPLLGKLIERLIVRGKKAG